MMPMSKQESNYRLSSKVESALWVIKKVKPKTFAITQQSQGDFSKRFAKNCANEWVFFGRRLFIGRYRRFLTSCGEEKDDDDACWDGWHSGHNRERHFVAPSQFFSYFNKTNRCTHIHLFCRFFVVIPLARPTLLPSAAPSFHIPSSTRQHSSNYDVIVD